MENIIIKIKEDKKESLTVIRDFSFSQTTSFGRDDCETDHTKNTKTKRITNNQRSASNHTTSTSLNV